jgi:hypothetical protein
LIIPLIGQRKIQLTYVTSAKRARAGGVPTVGRLDLAATRCKSAAVKFPVTRS